MVEPPKRFPRPPEPLPDEYDLGPLDLALPLLPGDAAPEAPPPSPSIPGGAPPFSAMLASSCAFFAAAVLTGPPDEPYNGHFLLGDHHMAWDRLLRDHRRLCVLSARDHGKTFFFGFAFPLWKAYHFPESVGYIFSAAQKQSDVILDRIRSEVENNPKLQWMIPRKKTHWGSEHLEFSNGHHIFARGYGTRVRGGHPIWILLDDGLNDEDAYSETTRNKHKDYFYTAISNMLVPRGQIIAVGTPFHSQDLYASLAANSEYKFAVFPAESAPERPQNRALWAARYPLATLAAKRREVGPIRYAREFLCQPVADDMSLFPERLFRGQPTEQLTLTLGMSGDFWKQAGIQVFMGVDFAMSSSVQADYTVIWTMGRDKQGNRWIIDIRREKGLAYQDQMSLINEVAREYSPGLIFLEANQMQRIFGDELIRLSDLPIRKFTTGTNKNSLDRGVPSLRVLLENGKFRIPRGDKRSVDLTGVWIEEMRSFTWHNGKLQSVGGHDDTVLACWICDQAIRAGAFDFSFGDEAEFAGGQSQEKMADMYADLTGAPKPAAEKPAFQESQLIDKDLL